MGNDLNKKIGIITFHNSYNCGSMLQAFALQQVINRLTGRKSEIVDFSNEGQQKLYSVRQPNDSLKNVIKNIILAPWFKRIARNYESYERFKKNNFRLSNFPIHKSADLSDADYDIVVAGSDQVWNITIEDGDDAYFLPWVKLAKKVAYAPSFGAKNIADFADDPIRYAKYLKDFSCLSIRERNGVEWLQKLTGRSAELLLDPTLLLKQDDYAKIESHELKLPLRYIFYYSPGYSRDINKLVHKISQKYNLPVIAFNTKTFYIKGMQFSGFKLPKIEKPSRYLQLIKNAEMIITTSFHGTVFSTIYRKKFWTVKNGGMFGSDDRVKTLMYLLDLEDRMIPIEFDDGFNYLKEKNYNKYEHLLEKEQERAYTYLKKALVDRRI